MLTLPAVVKGEVIRGWSLARWICMISDNESGRSICSVILQTFCWAQTCLIPGFVCRNINTSSFIRGSWAADFGRRDNKRGQSWQRQTWFIWGLYSWWSSEQRGRHTDISVKWTEWNYSDETAGWSSENILTKSFKHHPNTFFSSGTDETICSLELRLQSLELTVEFKGWGWRSQSLHLMKVWWFRFKLLHLHDSAPSHPAEMDGWYMDPTFRQKCSDLWWWWWTLSSICQHQHDDDDIVLYEQQIIFWTQMQIHRLSCQFKVF